MAVEYSDYVTARDTAVSLRSKINDMYGVLSEYVDGNIYRGSLSEVAMTTDEKAELGALYGTLKGDLIELCGKLP